MNNSSYQRVPGGSPRVGIIGGSGLGVVLDGLEHLEIDTPFGRPSAPIAVGEFAGQQVAFLPRHGVRHEFPPHRIPYRANICALASLGVERIIAVSAVGSLQPGIHPRDFVVCDQLVDLTKNRASSLHDGAPVTHIAFAEPFCPQLRPLAVDSCRSADINTHANGTVVVVDGPRFSTIAESQWYSRQGWQVINMTVCPEAALAREAEMCYVNIAHVTDYDVGFHTDSGIDPVSTSSALQVIEDNNKRIPSVVTHLLETIAHQPQTECSCRSALAVARFTPAPEIDLSEGIAVADRH